MGIERISSTSEKATLGKLIESNNGDEIGMVRDETVSRLVFTQPDS